MDAARRNNDACRAVIFKTDKILRIILLLFFKKNLSRHFFYYFLFFFIQTTTERLPTGSYITHRLIEEQI